MTASSADAGADFFTPGAGNDTFDGSNTGGLDGAGFDNDTINYHNIGATAGLDANFNTGLIQKTINNVAFTDTVIDVERIRGTAFGDNMRGSDTANFRQERFEGLNGADTMNGGAGSDLVRYDNDQRFGGGSVGVTVRFDLGTAVDGFGATDIISISRASSGRASRTSSRETAAATSCGSPMATTLSMAPQAMTKCRCISMTRSAAPVRSWSFGRTAPSR